jgi:type II secretion system protein N
MKLDLSLARLRQIDWNVWKPRLGYAAFFLVAFVFAFRQTFPVQALKERLILEASARGWQVDAAEVGPSGIIGMRATDVVLQDRGGLRLSLDEVAVSFRLLPLLLGTRSVAFEVALWDGVIEGTADVGAGDRRVRATVKGLDLARAAPLRQAIKLELLGVVSGSADLTLAGDPAGKAKGRVELSVAELGVNGGQLPLPGMSSPLTIPRVGLGTLSGEVVLADGKGTFEKLEARNGDAELNGEGLYFVPQARLAASPIYGKVGVRISDAFLDRPGNAAFKGLLDLGLRGARGKDGFYQLQVYGSLGGPQARPIASGTSGFPMPGPPVVPPQPGGPTADDLSAPPTTVEPPTGDMGTSGFPGGRTRRLRRPETER